jgi:sugar phosphate isomerase/epimerase
MEVLETPDIGICFDIGHWHCFSAIRGERQDLDQWIDAFAPRLRHLHLHDNDGSYDAHLGLGQGTIPFDELLRALKARSLFPSTTFEPHTAKALAGTCHWFARRPEAAAQIGWTPPRDFPS